MRLIQIELDGAKNEERFFSENTRNIQLPKLENTAKNDFTRKWVKSNLENYFLSSNFNDKESLIQISKSSSFCPKQYQNSDKPVFEISLSDNIILKYCGVIEFLNSLNKEIKWDVPTTERKYMEYIDSKSKRNQKVKLILKCDNGFGWYQLLNKEALEYESHKMRNCIGHESAGHIDVILSKKYTALSLRKNNNPHITLKYNTQSHVITDLVGKENSFNPKEIYYPYIIEIMNFLKLEPQLPFNVFKNFEFVNGAWRIKEVKK